MGFRPPAVHEDEVDGLATFWAETPPPLTAALSFRVGTWDESALNVGITHLVEHLALHPLCDTEHEYNAVVGGDSLTFWATGSEAELARFFDRLVASLRSLPVDRLETEVQVLRAETARTHPGSVGTLLAILFGPNGPGLAMYPEHGFDLVGPKEAQAWADRHCTRRNAVLAVSGPSRPSIRLDLPVGEYRAFSLPGPDVGYRPDELEIVARQEGGICVGALAERSSSLVLACELLNRRMTDWLRHELGLVYEVGTSYVPLDAERAFLYAGVDARETDLEPTAWEFMSVVRGLRDECPSPDELSRRQKQMPYADRIAEASLARHEVHRVAMDRLLGYPCFSWDEYMTMRSEATPESVRTAFREATDRGAVVAPDLPTLALNLPDRKRRASTPVEGKTYRPRRRIADAVERLIVGPDGLTVRTGGRWVTFRWSDIASAHFEAPSVWHLLNRNGAWVALDPRDWWRRRKISRLLEEGIPREVRLPRARRP